jgi:hypothetical protein
MREASRYFVYPFRYFFPLAWKGGLLNSILHLYAQVAFVRYLYVQWDLRSIGLNSCTQIYPPNFTGSASLNS